MSGNEKVVHMHFEMETLFGAYINCMDLLNALTSEKVTPSNLSKVHSLKSKFLAHWSDHTSLQTGDAV